MFPRTFPHNMTHDQRNFHTCSERCRDRIPESTCLAKSLKLSIYYLVVTVGYEYKSKEQ